MGTRARRGSRTCFDRQCSGFDRIPGFKVLARTQCVAAFVLAGGPAATRLADGRQLSLGIMNFAASDVRPLYKLFDACATWYDKHTSVLLRFEELRAGFLGSPTPESFRELAIGY